MSSYRLQRLERLIQIEISDLIRSEIKDPRIVPLKTTITAVKLSKDYKYATIFISVLGTEKEESKTLEGFKSAKGYLQGRIGKLIRIRFTPELRFKVDDSLKKGDDIINKLNELD